jgi:hypothetical protein
LLKRLTKKFQSNNVKYFNSNWSNKIYFKGPDKWFYELKNENNFQNKTQRHKYNQVVSQNNKHISKKKHRLKLKN